MYVIGWCFQNKLGFMFQRQIEYQLHPHIWSRADYSIVPTGIDRDMNMSANYFFNMMMLADNRA